MRLLLLLIVATHFTSEAEAEGVVGGAKEDFDFDIKGLDEFSMKGFDDFGITGATSDNSLTSNSGSHNMEIVRGSTKSGGASSLLKHIEDSKGGKDMDSWSADSKESANTVESGSQQQRSSLPPSNGQHETERTSTDKTPRQGGDGGHFSAEDNSVKTKHSPTTASQLSAATEQACKSLNGNIAGTDFNCERNCDVQQRGAGGSNGGNGGSDGGPFGEGKEDGKGDGQAETNLCDAGCRTPNKGCVCSNSALDNEKADFIKVVEPSRERKDE